MPQLRINPTTSEWEISYDEDKTFESLHISTKGTKGADSFAGLQGISLFQSIEETGSDVTITLTDGEKLSLPKQNGMSINFDKDVVKVEPNKTYQIKYTLSRADLHVRAIVEGAYTVKVAPSSTGLEGTITLTSPAVVENVLLTVMLGDGTRMLMKTISVERETTLAGTEATDPDTTPLDENKYIDLQLSSGETTFKLAGLNGKNITIEGVQPNSVVDAQGKVTAYLHVPNNLKEVEFTAATPGGKVRIKGNIVTLAITAGKIDNVNMSDAPTTFANFYLYETGASGSLKTSDITFGNITTLKVLYLGISPDRKFVGPYIYRTARRTIDINRLVNLEELGLHGLNGESHKATLSGTAALRLKNLILSESSDDNFPVFTTENYPNLRSLMMLGVYRQKRPDIDFHDHDFLSSIYISRTHIPTYLRLDGSKALRSVIIREPRQVGATVINMLNTPKLSSTGIRFQNASPGTILKELSVNSIGGWTVKTTAQGN